MGTTSCKFCKYQTKTGEICTICGCITTHSKSKSINSNSMFIDYSYNNYSSGFKKSIFQSWNNIHSYLLFNENIFAKLGKFILSPITILNPDIRLPTHGKLIEIGCGKGDFLKYLPKKVDFLGVDIIDYGLNNPKIKVLNFETEKIELKFNIARSIHSIEHAQDPKNFLRKISNIMEPQGLLVIATPNSKFWLKNYFKESWVPLNVETHYCILNTEALKKELKEIGFETLYSSTYSIFSHIDSFSVKFKFKSSPFTFLLTVLLLYPVAIFEKLFKVSDSIIIYAKKN